MSARRAAAFHSPAVFLVNGLGDQLIALPAIRALATIFPGGLQLLLGEGMLSFFYHGLPVSEGVRAWWSDYDKRVIDVERTLRGTAPCDLFLCLSTWATPSVADLARRMGATWSIGYFDILNVPLPVDESANMFDRLFTIPQCFGENLRIEGFSAAPNFSTAAEDAAKRFVDKHIVPGERLLFTHPETRHDKMWNLESFSWVVERFLDVHPEFRVFVSALDPSPMEFRRHRHRVVWVDHHLELALAMVRHADLFLGVDSCFMHAADLFRVPGVALFGPTDPRQWGFRFSPLTRTIWGKGSMNAIQRAPVLDALLEVAGLCGKESSEARMEQGAPATERRNRLPP